MKVACALLVCATSGLGASVFQAIVPNGGGVSSTDFKVEWYKFDFPGDLPESTADITISKVDSDDSLGAWNNLDLGAHGALFAAKIHNDVMYVYMNTKSSLQERPIMLHPDTIRAFPRTGNGAYTDFDLEAAWEQAMSDPDAAPRATHTFDVADIDGVPHAFCMLQYGESSLGYAPTDAIGVISLKDGSLRLTADGAPFLNFVTVAGATSANEDSTRFKIQYLTTGGREQWHGNGVARFTTADGTNVLAMTGRWMLGSALLKDPYTYSSSQGGGLILQRFGSPQQFDANAQPMGVRYFGVNKSDAISSNDGVHNVYYQRYASGRETVTMFANGMDKDSVSHVFEFDIQFTDGKTGTSDDVFSTHYESAAFTFHAPNQGGARPLGLGVWIGASGGGKVGLQIVDRQGQTKTIAFDLAPVYDPFVHYVPNGVSVMV